MATSTATFIKHHLLQGNGLLETVGGNFDWFTSSANTDDSIQELKDHCRIDGSSGMKVGQLNLLLDELQLASRKKPGMTSTPGKPADQGRRKATQQSTKGNHLRSIVTRVDQAELRFVLNVIIKSDKGLGAGGCDTFMKHVHEDAYKVMDTCDSCSMLSLWLPLCVMHLITLHMHCDQAANQIDWSNQSSVKLPHVLHLWATAQGTEQIASRFHSIFGVSVVVEAQ
jgi:hypothetical protein